MRAASPDVATISALRRWAGNMVVLRNETWPIGILRFQSGTYEDVAQGWPRHRTCLVGTREPQPLARHKLGGRRPRLRPSKVSGVLDRSRRLVLLQVGPIYGVLQALTSRDHRANGDLSPAHLNGASRLLEERLIPAARPDAPRPDEHATVHHHGPDTDKAMRLGARPNAEHLLVVDGGEGFARETAVGGHRPGFRSRASSACQAARPTVRSFRFAPPPPPPLPRATMAKYSCAARNARRLPP